MRLTYSKTILLYTIVPVLFLTSCTTTVPPVPIESVTNTMDDVKNAVTSSGSTVINNSLEWWQWVIIGMFIPSPLDYLSSLFSGFGGFILKLFGRK
ncbi:hypothetical protein OLCHANIL_00251 [Vibrio phage V05]|nr:hypothetical protein OLCHANIL_00251 [Vibrio phage V05]